MSTPLPTPEISTLRKWAILIFLALIWGSSFILIKKGLVVFSPPQAAAVRLMAAFFTPLVEVAQQTTQNAKDIFLN